MPKLHVGPDLEELLVVGGRSQLSSDAKSLRRIPQQSDIPRRVRSSNSMRRCWPPVAPRGAAGSSLRAVPGRSLMWGHWEATR